MEKYLENIFKVGIQHSEILEVWNNQEKIHSQLRYFGIYEKQGKILFLNFNETYVFIKKQGIGQSWSKIKSGFYKIENDKIILSNEGFQKTYFEFKIQKDEAKLFLIDSESNEIFVKTDYPCVKKCITSTYNENSFSNSLIENNLYVLTSVIENEVTVLNNNKHFKKYPLEIFENEI